MKKELASYLSTEKKLLNLIFHQVKLGNELICHWYFAGKLKISFFIKPNGKQTYVFSYLFSQRTLIHLIFIRPNRKKTLFFNHLQQRNSKRSYGQIEKNNFSFLFSKKTSYIRCLFSQILHLVKNHLLKRLFLWSWFSTLRFW